MATSFIGILQNVLQASSSQLEHDYVIYYPPGLNRRYKILRSSEWMQILMNQYRLDSIIMLRWIIVRTKYPTYRSNHYSDLLCH